MIVLEREVVSRDTQDSTKAIFPGCITFSLSLSFFYDWLLFGLFFYLVLNSWVKINWLISLLVHTLTSLPFDSREGVRTTCYLRQIT